MPPQHSLRRWKQSTGGMIATITNLVCAAGIVLATWGLLWATKGPVHETKRQTGLAEVEAKSGPTCGHGSTPGSAECCRSANSWLRISALGRSRRCVGGTKRLTARSSRHDASAGSAGPPAGNTGQAST